MMRFGLNRGQRARPAQDDTGDENYPEALAVWQIRNGLNSLDLTREQNERFRAFEQTGDADRAKHLIYGRRMARRGQFNDQ